jgi:hypothetical protein
VPAVAGSRSHAILRGIGMGSDETRRARESEQEAADLAALADGSLPPERRREVEERVAASPRLQLLLLEQRAALEAIRARDERAPQRLRETIERLSPAGDRRLYGVRARSRRRYRVAIPLAVAAAALAVAALLVVLPASEPAAPTLTQVAALAARPPTSAQPADGHATAWGLEYPNLSREYRWREAGSRSDRLRARTARTAFYRKDGHRIAYTIVSTGSVRVPHGTRSWQLKGRPWYVFEDDGRTVVAWERKGHMCVVSASGVGGRTLVRMITD